MKPFTLQVQETEQGIVNIINDSKLPAYVLKAMLQGIYQQIEQLELNEIEEYNKNKNKKKESDK